MCITMLDTTLHHLHQWVHLLNRCKGTLDEYFKFYFVFSILFDCAFPKCISSYIVLCIGAGQLFHLHLLFTSYGAHTIVHQSHLPFLGHHLGQRYPLWPSMCVAQVEYSKCCSGLHLVIVCFSNFHAATSVSSDRKQQQLHFDCCWQHLTCSIDSLAGVSEALVLWTKDRCWQFWCCQSQILGDRSTQKGVVVNWEWRRIVRPL